ncbi:putative bifunctional diguanylate cyclase/phosphodiesterase [Tardiphaga sp.]|jgi:diguanylate cyclase (GGDEF)-like protein|uniref:putative bifunctional diguanylate cyclase/phosphodiesterase n=1 Tax=Tardiphaga sp. TaxID=1926292 RepID=UPI0037DA4939
MATFLSLRSFVNWLLLRDASPQLLVAKYQELKHQIPLLYALLSLNALAVAFTHLEHAPHWMTIWIPGVLVLVSVVRMSSWLKRSGVIDAPTALRQLRRTILLGSLLAAAYISWSLGLSQFGGDHEQTHVAIFIAITVIGCIFCLMPLPQAAVAVTAIVMMPALYYYLSFGDAVYAAIGINIALVTAVLIRVVLSGYQAFRSSVLANIETQRLNAEITAIAHTDPLTQLPNRRLFFSELAERCAAARYNGHECAVGLIDLDRFKAVNDTMGHIFGDQLLQTVAQRLKEAFSEHGLVARLGGDEFAFCIEADGCKATAFANTVCEAISAPYVIAGANVSIGATCGIALLSTVGDEDSLYDAADYALYKGKSDRRGFATLYAARHEALLRADRAIEAALQSANLSTEMEVHYQPIVDHNQRVIAVEALARWNSPVLGNVRPDIFIPLAEKTGNVHRLTLILFEKALQLAVSLPEKVKLSFNLSAHDLMSSETILGLIALIRRSGIAPAKLIFELTETAVMRDFDAAEESLTLLRALGVAIALDDFGTGQSSLSYLRRLNVHKVKIDRSFVADVHEHGGQNLLAAIVALCNRMDIKCIAEGVETSDQLKALNELGCQAFQGYLFSKPLPEAQLCQWLDGHYLTDGGPSRVETPRVTGAIARPA